MDFLTKYWLFYLLAFVSEIIGTVSGFGSSILFVPLAALFFDFDLVLAITAIFHVFSNLFKIGLFRKGIDKQIVLNLGIPAIIFVGLGAFLTQFFELRVMELIMNIILVAMAIYLFINVNRKLQDTKNNLILGGVLSGFLAGLVGTGGAIRGLVLTAFQMEKDIFIATSAAIDLGVDVTRASIYVAQGYFNWSYIMVLPFLVVISFLGTYVGKHILTFVSQHIFRIIVLSTIVLTAMIQLVKHFW